MPKIPRTEDLNIEFKESWNDDVLKWVCAFANAQGGDLWIGVRDDGTPVGVRNAKKLQEDIPNKIVSLLGIVPEVALVHHRGMDCIRIRVEPSNIPISLRGIYHVRSGATKQELSGIALQQFILRKLGRTWDDIPCHGATMADIDRKAVSYFIQRAREAGRIPEGASVRDLAGTLQSLDLLAEDGTPKCAAILLFGKHPGCFFPAVAFRIGRFGTDETDLIVQDSIEGNIIQMPDRVVERLRTKYLLAPIHYEGMHRKEPLEIPEDALREAIYNSVVHKDYTGVHIQLRVYADRLELWNDGGLPEGWTVRKLLANHSSKPRNKNIAATFYRAGFIEAWGRGIRKIREGFLAAGLPEPKIEAADGGVRITLYRPAWVARELGAGSRADNAQVAAQDNAQVAPSVTHAVANAVTHAVDNAVSHQVMALLSVLTEDLGNAALLKVLALKNRDDMRIRYISPALRLGFIEYTIPDKPHSRFQKYRLTAKGRAALANLAQ